MKTHALLPILALGLLPSLNGCAQPEEFPAEPSEEAMAAVTSDAGAPRKDVARELDDLFDRASVGDTRAVVLMANGKIAAERYGEGYGPDTRLVSWSMAKTLTAVLIGMLVADGKLALDDPAPVGLWQRAGDPRSAITLRHLLQMRSGLRHTEAGDPPYESSEARMLFLDGRDDMARWAEEQPLEAEPGAKFEYSSSTTVILADIATRALTSSDVPQERAAAVRGYLEAHLFAPLGMDSMVPEFDASGTLIGGSLIHGTARDWARFGEFLRRKGRTPGGEQLVPRAWIEKMVTPSPKSPHYGFQTWLNRPADGEHAALFPGRSSPTDFGLSGHMGQYVVTSPARRITIARLGHSSREEREVLMQEIADIFELYPER